MQKYKIISMFPHAKIYDFLAVSKIFLQFKISEIKKQFYSCLLFIW